MKSSSKLKYIFYGSGPLAENSLATFIQNNFLPSLVITTANQKSGRRLQLQENPILTLCKANKLKSWQPISLKNLNLKETPLNEEFDLAIVASYPKILPKEILQIPKYGNLNIHPSLLPKYRGPSPISTAILNGEEKIAVSIILLDEEIDHGPILIQKELTLLETETNLEIEKKSGQLGAQLILEVLEAYLSKTLKLKEQKHSQATFTYKFQKADGEITLEDTALEIQNKFRALTPHIPLFFFIQHHQQPLRIKIIEIDFNKKLNENKLARDIILKVIPEGKPAMTWENFKNGYLKD